MKITFYVQTKQWIMAFTNEVGLSVSVSITRELALTLIESDCEMYIEN